MSAGSSPENRIEKKLRNADEIRDNNQPLLVRISMRRPRLSRVPENSASPEAFHLKRNPTSAAPVNRGNQRRKYVSRTWQRKSSRLRNPHPDQIRSRNASSKTKCRRP